MLKKHQIKKIIKQMVPSSVYSNPQRKMLRETAKTAFVQNADFFFLKQKNHEINDRYRRTIIYCLPYCLFYCRQFGAADLCFLISL